MPNAGEVERRGRRNLASLSEAARGQVRNRALGFIYQFHHLLPEFSAVENAAMPLLIRRISPAAAHAAARTCSSAWASAIVSSIGPASCRAASASASRSRARS